MRKSQGKNRLFKKNSEENMNQDIYESNAQENIQNCPPIKIPVIVTIALIIAIYLALNFFFFSPKKSFWGPLPKNEYIHFMNSQPKVVQPTTKDEQAKTDDAALNTSISEGQFIEREGL